MARHRFATDLDSAASVRDRSRRSGIGSRPISTERHRFAVDATTCNDDTRIARQTTCRWFDAIGLSAVPRAGEMINWLILDTDRSPTAGVAVRHARFLVHDRCFLIPDGSERVKGDETTSYADLMSASRVGSLIQAT